MTDIVYCPPNVDCPCYAKLVSENATLRAEVERQVQWVKDLADNLIAEEAKTATLRAEVERLEGVMEPWRNLAKLLEGDVAALRATNERLGAALREYLDADDHLAKVMPQLVAEGVIAAAIERVRAAKRDARQALAQEKPNG